MNTKLTFNIGMELCKKGSLKDIVERTYIAREIAQTLQHLKANDVIHRDIKLGNILVNHHGIVKLADFGLACTLTNMNSLQQSEMKKAGYVSLF